MGGKGPFILLLQEAYCPLLPVIIYLTFLLCVWNIK